MEEYKLFLERHPDYYDDGLIVDDENQSYSELDKIAQPKRSRTKVIMTPLAIMLLSSAYYTTEQSLSLS